METTENIHKERIAFTDLPEGMINRLMKIEDLINNSTLEFHLLELIRYRVAQINNCAYCLDMHYKELIQLGETQSRLHSLSAWRETPFFTEKERVLMEFTEQLTELDERGVSDAVFEKLASLFTKAEISLLTLTVSQINTWTRLMRTFRIEPGNYKIQRW